MTKEKISEYTLRISQANKSELIVILYDMALTYIDDAEAAVRENNHEGLKENCKNAGKVVSELLGTLDYSNELALSLRQCYTFIQSQIMMAVVKNREDELVASKRMLSSLRESFAEIAKKDTSEVLMGNSQNVYTGLTYGRKAVYDSLTTEVKRGFTV